ncbi:MAG: hypothetical protein AUI63_03750 [Gemmatimonadetes bacterium 13_1_40CM_2_60_3]|nr:MAG: hypothetical protein AUI63_03750 [Gemmatimonadetes bacterium 13_1_40CM_2_60_3]
MRTHPPGIAEIRRDVIRGGLLVSREQRSRELRWLTSFEISERIKREGAESVRDESDGAPLLVDESAKLESMPARRRQTGDLITHLEERGFRFLRQ